MAKSKVIISVIGIENHPDICSVLDYYEDHGVIPPYYDEFAFCCPTDDYDEYGSRLGYAMKTGRKVLVPINEKGDNIVTFAHYQSKSGNDDWIFVLACCETKEDEQLVADYYKEKVLESGIVPEDRVYIVLSEDNDPKFPEDKIESLLFSGDHIDGLAANLLNKYLGKNNFTITGCSYSFAEVDCAEYEINFSYLAKDFCITFNLEDGKTMATLAETRNGIIVEKNKYYFIDFPCLKDYILQHFFGTDEMKKYVKSDVEFISPVPEVKDNQLVYRAYVGTDEVNVTIDPKTKAVLIRDPETEEPAMPADESMEAKVDFLIRQVKWLREQNKLQAEAIRRLEAK